MLVQIAGVVVLIIILQFFRNPKRIAIRNSNQILAPVDGKVVVIEEVYEIKKPTKAAKTTPPRNPSMVFLGEIRSNNLCFPIDFPTK